MKTIILYKTQWGTTKQYAEWIHEAVAGTEIGNLDEYGADTLHDYGMVVVGSRTYMGRIAAKNWLEENWHGLKGKKVYLFAVGLVPANSEQGKQSYEMIAEEVRNGLAGYVKIPGKVDVDKLNFWQKMIAKSTQASAPAEVDKSDIQPIVDFIRGIER
ncbi:MAG: flavodoxin domain-containing protein [Patescibacteria group bacterium]|nr:flavodoxin domain-containing protein [Patescibacteria group bacterium]MDD5715778.1 flavodoxin domain-containing protein [Patescibacteria group bacterium]